MRTRTSIFICVAEHPKELCGGFHTLQDTEALYSRRQFPSSRGDDLIVNIPRPTIVKTIVKTHRASSQVIYPKIEPTFTTHSPNPKRKSEFEGAKQRSGILGVCISTIRPYNYTFDNAYPHMYIRKRLSALYAHSKYHICGCKFEAAELCHAHPQHNLNERNPIPLCNAWLSPPEWLDDWKRHPKQLQEPQNLHSAERRAANLSTLSVPTSCSS